MSQPHYTPAPSADFVLPFDLPDVGLRGRILRLDEVSTRALAAHPLPESGQRVLAEALGLSALLGSALKLEGRLSVQTKGGGPLNLLATDYFAGGGLRGYARVDEKLFAESGRSSHFGSAGRQRRARHHHRAQEGRAAPSGPGAAVARGARPLGGNLFRAERAASATMLRLAAGPVYRAGRGALAGASARSWCRRCRAPRSAT